MRSRLRSFVAALLACTTFALAVPTAAFADEVSRPMVALVEPPGRVDVRARLALARAAVAPTAAVFAASPEEIRLSQGAKTAIIVTAIVVGALLIVGVVALRGPGHP